MISEVDFNTLKILSAVLMFVGTVLVSWRVTKILSALSTAVQMIDLNHQTKMERARGNLFMPNIQFVGTHKQVQNAEKQGVKLLITGFIMQIAGVSCNVMSFVI